MKSTNKSLRPSPISKYLPVACAFSNMVNRNNLLKKIKEEAEKDIA